MDRNERMIEKRIRERECHVDLYSTGARRPCAYLDGCPWSRVPTAAMRDVVRRGDEVTSLRRGGLRHFFLTDDEGCENLLWEACDLKSSAYLLGHGYTHETGLYDTHFWRKETR